MRNNYINHGTTSSIVWPMQAATAVVARGTALHARPALFLSIGTMMNSRKDEHDVLAPMMPSIVFGVALVIGLAAFLSMWVADGSLPPAVLTISLFVCAWSIRVIERSLENE